MPGKSDKDLFSSSKAADLNGLDNIKTHEDNNKKTFSEGDLKTSVQDSIFDRKVMCPVCSKSITVKAVKASKIRIISRDTDLMTYYQEPNPSFYDVWFCPLCGYAALSAKFNTLRDKQISLIKENISSKWQADKVYPSVYDAATAIEIHKLALLNTIIKLGKASEKAMLCLKLAWLYRLSKNETQEIKYLTEAKNGFLSAYEEEDFPIAGMDKPTLQYLLGELFRRIGDNKRAVQYFGKVLVDRDAKPKIKDMARDQKDLIFNEKDKETLD